MDTCTRCKEPHPSYICGNVTCDILYCSQYCANVDWKNGHKLICRLEAHNSFRDEVMDLLDQWNNPQALRKGIRQLHRAFLPHIKRPIRVLIDDCNDWPSNRAQVARQTTLGPTYYQIELCEDVLNREWQATQSGTVKMHNPDKHTHVAVVLLHEFGHIMDQLGELDDMCPYNDPEDRASWFADQFILYGRNALNGDAL